MADDALLLYNIQLINGHPYFLLNLMFKMVNLTYRYIHLLLF